MDIAHSWGAVLLLDEADVFLEKRQHQDVHRNALVSIFLRLLEYFQGILFLVRKAKGRVLCSTISALSEGPPDPIPNYYFPPFTIEMHGKQFANIRPPRLDHQ